MKRILIVAAALALSGCSDSNFFGDSPDQTTTVASAPAQAPSEPATAEGAPAPMQQPVPAPADTAATEQTPTVQSTPEPLAPVAQASPSSNAHCTALAKQRARDAAFAGEDSDTQEAVYKSTHADCVAWDLKHSL